MEYKVNLGQAKSLFTKFSRKFRSEKVCFEKSDKALVLENAIASLERKLRALETLKVNVVQAGSVSMTIRRKQPSKIERQFYIKKLVLQGILRKKIKDLKSKLNKLSH